MLFTPSAPKSVDSFPRCWKVRHIFTFIFNPLLLIPLFFFSFHRCQPLCGKNNISCIYFIRLLSIKSFFHSRFHGILVSLNEDNAKGLSLYINANLTYLHAWEFNPLSPELNPICYLLALLGAHHLIHVSRIRVRLLTFRLLMSYIYRAPILDVSRSHTTTQHSR